MVLGLRKPMNANYSGGKLCVTRIVLITVAYHHFAQQACHVHDVIESHFLAGLPNFSSPESSFSTLSRLTW
jgi:hypothetical protein